MNVLASTGGGPLGTLIVIAIVLVVLGLLALLATRILNRRRRGDH